MTVYSGKIEMGQGIITSLAQMVADELDAPLESINMIMGDTDLRPFDNGTYGSMSTRFFGPALRTAAAEARAILIELAAEHLKVLKEKLAAENGVVFAAADRTARVTYGHLARGQKVTRRRDGKTVLKPLSGGELQRFCRGIADRHHGGEGEYGSDGISFEQYLRSQDARRAPDRCRAVRLETSRQPSKRGFGIACGIDAGTYVAEIAEVQVDKETGAVKAKRIVCAPDMGIVINPEGAKMQMEGCVTMGLGYSLSEEVRFKGGEILERNFDTYELPRFSSLPRIEAILVKNDELSPQGGGEPAIVPVGAAIANAIFDATGARLFQLPMTPARVKQAIGQG